MHGGDAAMLHRLLGEGSNAATLKQALDASSTRARGIASRIANIGNGSFADALAQAGAVSKEAQLETEMVALADEQLRFDAAARLLQRTYAGLRSSIKER
jgi:flagellar basal body rod protein FlgB